MHGVALVNDPDANAEWARSLGAVVAALERSTGHAIEQVETYRQQLQANERARHDLLARIATLDEAVTKAERRAGDAEAAHQRALADTERHRATAEAMAIESAVVNARTAALQAHREVALIAARRAIARAAAAEAQTTALERRACAAEAQATALEQRARAAEAQAIALEQRARAADQRAADWQQRHDALLASFSRILNRTGLLAVARLVPRPIRRFVLARLLGRDRA